MLEERVEEWVAGWKKEGFEEGLVKGKADLLKRQLTKRFGPLPTWASDKLDHAASIQIEAWAEGIFDADCLETLLSE